MKHGVFLQSNLVNMAHRNIKQRSPEFVPLELQSLESRDPALVETVLFSDEGEYPSFAEKGRQLFRVSADEAKDLLLQDDISPQGLQAVIQDFKGKDTVLMVAGLPYIDDQSNAKILVNQQNNVVQHVVPLSSLYELLPKMHYRHVKLADGDFLRDTHRAQVIQAVNQAMILNLATRVRVTYLDAIY